jgi:small nuclear ribonucleoprotein D2
MSVFIEESELGPLSVLASAIKTNSQILINCRNNRKLLGRVKAFDRHLNILLENVKEVWTERDNAARDGKFMSSRKDRFINKLFLRGDSIILILKNPK